MSDYIYLYAIVDMLIKNAKSRIQNLLAKLVEIGIGDCCLYFLSPNSENKGSTEFTRFN